MKKQEAGILKENRQHGTVQFRCCLYANQQSAAAQEPRQDVRHHWHEEMELLYFKAGSYRLIVNMEEFLIDEECFCFVNPGELHAIHMVKPEEDYALLYHPDMLAFAVPDAAQQKLLKPLADGELSFPLFVKVSDLAFLAVKQAYEALVQYFKLYGQKSLVEQSSCHVMHGIADQLMVKADLLKLVALLHSYGMLNRKVWESQKQVKVIKDAVNYIHENYKQKIYIRDLAELTGLNEQYFIRFFGNTLGKSPIEYINDYRVKRAQALLCETGLAVTEVAAECGFHNMGNFIKIFKDVSGTTPLRYRKLYAKPLEL